MDNIKHAANYVGDSAKGAVSSGQYEAHKQIAKDSNVPLSTRARAAGDMVSDKIDEHKHNTSADVNKEAAKH